MQTIYLKAKHHNVIRHSCVTLRDIGKWECADRTLLDEVQQITLHQFEEKQQKSQLEFFSVMRVIALIHEIFPQADVVSLGEKDFIVEYLTAEQEPKWIGYLKLAVLCLIIFFGSSFTIMAFNNDVDIMGIFDRFYTQVTGVKKPAVSELEVAYSLGIAVGILVFFNHIGRRKFSSDPTPIQVEVTKFRKDMDDALIENAEREGHEKDVS